MEIKVVDFVPLGSNTMQGFVTVELVELGLEIPGFAIHQKGESRWVELPAKPPTNSDNNDKWIKVINFYDRRKESEFKKLILKDYDKYMDHLEKE
jgi:hypothetical protein